MSNSTYRFAETHPVVAGGIYERVSDSGRVDHAFMGAVCEEEGRVVGDLYIHGKGSVPVPVVENTESMLGWKLIRCGTSKATEQYLRKHEVKTAAEIARVTDNRAEARKRMRYGSR